MRTLKPLMLALVLCMGTFVTAACREGGQKAAPDTMTKIPTQKAAIGCPCCPPPRVMGEDAALGIIGAADGGRVQAGRRETSDPTGETWVTRDSYQTSLQKSSVFDSVGCCPCFTYAATATRTTNKSNPVTLDTTLKDLGSIELGFPSRGIAYVTVIGDVVRSTGKVAQTQVEFKIEMSEPTKSTAAIARSKILDIPAAAPGDEGSVIKFRERFTVDETTTVFALKGAARTGNPGDRIEGRVIHVMFLPDLE